MNENLIETQNIEKRSKIKDFYEKNKIRIILFLVSIIILVISLTFYLETKKDKRLALSENYIDAKIHLAKGEKDKAKDILQKIILKNDSTYSTLSLFLILNENLIVDKNELSNLFNYILENCKFEKEIEKLIIFKKALLETSYVNEEILFKSLKPLLTGESLWKPHALLLIGDYYLSKKENIKAKEFYTEILMLKNLPKEFYNRSKVQLTLLKNEQ
jgi:predicted negative regulator of RcsB-dependent stress response